MMKPKRNGSTRSDKDKLIELEESSSDDEHDSFTKPVATSEGSTSVNADGIQRQLTGVYNTDPTDDIPPLLGNDAPFGQTANAASVSAQQLSEPEPVFHLRSRTAAVNAESAQAAIEQDTYESLDYEVCENKLFLEEERRWLSERFSLRKGIMRWIIFIQIGIITALIACVIDIVIETLSEVKYNILKKSVDENTPMRQESSDLVWPYLYWIAWSIVPVLIGTTMVTFIEPITAGSGMPQVKSYLNGVKIPRIVRIKTLAVKTIGVITSVVGGLAGGKEGPMIHSGAVVAAGLSQGKSTTFVKDFHIFKAFRDDHEKRDFVLGGAAAGVAAAFGAPIGGMLFSLEEAASFWNQNLIWRTLVASIISSFTLNIVLSAYHGLQSLTFTGLFNLGKFDQPLTFNYYELPLFMLLGITGGLLGAAWNSLNTKINGFRRRYFRWKLARVCEAVMVAILGVTLACMMIYLINDCRPLGNDPTAYPVQLFCEDNEYNAVAALWFQTPEATVRALFHDPPGSHKILSLTIFTIVYYILSCLTFGLNVSLGVFIPTALVGAAWGRLFAMLLFYTFPEASFLHPGKYALIGAAANLGGVLRMTISLSVILMETTCIEPSFFFPLIITLISAKWVGDYFNEGLYDIQIEVNHVPVLPWEPLPQYKGLTAREILSKPVICIKLHDSAQYIYDVLSSSNHNGFPVVDDVKDDRRAEGRVRGIILRSQLIVILMKSLYVEKKRFWLDETSIETFRSMYPRYPSIKSVRRLDEKMNYTVDLEMFMNPSPVRVNAHDSVPKIFNIFRALGLRHLLVIDNENRIAGIITRRDFLYK
ncbi:H(+)/Cl(-) exchange transporter 7 [Scaptodrosophila lebanonensis]|uniref:Chloride channel protein n=1 Tax=Drosophila lebanonensis TaxID=7225 RepID=A0A6J2UG00_DROLE|nr:H(+)/Cl(-) exchange transporter 7 [Scaptodrosophila lebanonensis]